MNGDIQLGDLNYVRNLINAHKYDDLTDMNWARIAAGFNTEFMLTVLEKCLKKGVLKEDKANYLINHAISKGNIKGVELLCKYGVTLKDKIVSLFLIAMKNKQVNMTLYLISFYQKALNQPIKLCTLAEMANLWNMSELIPFIDSLKEHGIR